MLESTVTPNKPKRLIGLSQKASSQARVLLNGPTRTHALPVYRANLNHPVKFAEHGNAANSARPRDRADLTARRVRGHSIGKTEEAKASGNALDMPTSVWSEIAGKYAEPIPTEKANDDRRSLVDASQSCGLNGAAAHLGYIPVLPSGLAHGFSRLPSRGSPRNRRLAL